MQEAGEAQSTGQQCRVYVDHYMCWLLAHNPLTNQNKAIEVQEKPGINGIEIVIINYLCVGQKKTAIAVNSSKWNNNIELMSQ